MGKRNRGGKKHKHKHPKRNKGSPIVSMAAHLQAPVDGDSGTSGSKNFDSGISGARSVLRGPSLMTADTE